MNYLAYPGIDRYNTPDEVIDFVCKTMGADRKLVLSKSRLRSLVVVRQTAAYLISKKFKSKSLAEIGTYFDCDHATVIHSKKTVENVMTTELEYRIQIQEMKLILRIP